MTQHTLLYFPSPGRGEAIRDAFRIAKISFADQRIAFDTFRGMKASGELPYGTVPVLVVDGAQKRTIAQSNAILRYAGKLGGLYPNDPIDALRVDELLDVGEEINSELGPSMREPDLEKKLAMRKVLVETRLPHWLGCLERRLAENGNSRFFVGDSLTIADLKLLYVVEKLLDGSLDGVPRTILEPHPALVAWRDNVRAVRDSRVA